MKQLNKSRLMILIVVCTFSLFAISSSVQALMLEFSFEELVDGADAIVVGTVETTSSYWNEEQTNIYTITNISIKQNLKGTFSDETITVISKGGSVGDIWQWVEHEPVFTVGETVGLFLTKLPSVTHPDKKFEEMPQLSSAGAYYSMFALEQGMIHILGENVANTTGLPAEFFTEDVNLVLEGKPVLERTIEMQTPLHEESNSKPDLFKSVETEIASSQIIDSEYDEKDVETSDSDNGETADTELDEPIIDEITFDQTITSISPNIASAGTNAEVVVSGSGFGSRGAGDHLTFFYRNDNGNIHVASDIISWTNTQIRARVPVGIYTSPSYPSGYPGSASSGPVHIYKNGSFYSPTPFTVTFGYSGTRWSGANPTVTYRVNDGGNTARRTAVQNAGNSWSNAGANFSFNYGGTTTKTSVGLDWENIVIWTALSPGVLGQASVISSGGFIIDADFAFNTLFTWSTASTCPSGAFDVQSVAIHELGHWLNLRDLYGDWAGYPQDTAKIMYGRGFSGEVKRNLHAHDILGIQWIYGTASPWSKITTTRASVLAVDGGVVVGSFYGLGVYRYAGSSWQKLTGSVASALAFDNGVIVGSFPGLGVYRYAGSSWQKLTGSVAAKLVFDNGVLVGSFPGQGVFHYTSTGWRQLTGSVASELALENNDLAGSFPRHGVFRHASGSWHKLSGTEAQALAIDGGTLIGSFSGHGVFRRVGSSWQSLTGTPAEMLAYDGGVIAAYFPTHGVYFHDGRWQQISSAKNIVALAYKDGLLVVSNPDGVWLYE